MPATGTHDKRKGKIPDISIKSEDLKRFVLISLKYKNSSVQNALAQAQEAARSTTLMETYKKGYVIGLHIS